MRGMKSDFKCQQTMFLTHMEECGLLLIELVRIPLNVQHAVEGGLRPDPPRPPRASVAQI